MRTASRPLSAVAARVRETVRRGWYWGADYLWVTRAIIDGLLRPAFPSWDSYTDRRPVLLIPGVLEDWTMMRQIADRLHRAGHPVHALPQLRRNTMTVPQGALVASAYLDALDLTDVVIVAHSKGGLIGKQVMLADDERRVRHLIAIATPFAGSTLAQLVPSAMVRSLGPRDPTILALSARTQVNHKITSIFPAFDPHIPGGSHLDGATNIRLTQMGHFRVLAQPELLDVVVTAAAQQ